MRRLLGCLVVISLLIPALAAVASETEDFRDDFKTMSYAGNDGSLAFAGPWAEFGDNGSHSTGLVHVGPESCSGNRCLHIEGAGLVLDSFGARRAADLSDFESAELGYDIQIVPQGLTTAELHVQVYDGSWETVEEHRLSSATEEEVVLDVSDYIDEDFEVRFIVPDALDGVLLGLLYAGYATVDNVAITGTVAPPPTTSTTSTSTSTTSTTASTATTSPPGSGPTSSTSTTAPRPGHATTTSTTSPGAGPTTTDGDTGQGGGGSSTTTVVGRATTTTDDTGSGAGATTTTTVSSTSTTGPGAGAGAVNGPPPGSGLRESSIGLLADYRPGMADDMAMEQVEVLGAELSADFSLAVEAFEAAKVWIAILALVIAAALVSGMDSRRAREHGRGSAGELPAQR